MRASGAFTLHLLCQNRVHPARIMRIIIYAQTYETTTARASSSSGAAAEWLNDTRLMETLLGCVDLVVYTRIINAERQSGSTENGVGNCEKTKKTRGESYFRATTTRRDVISSKTELSQLLKSFSLFTLL